MRGKQISPRAIASGSDEVLEARDTIWHKSVSKAGIFPVPVELGRDSMAIKGICK